MEKTDKILGYLPQHWVKDSGSNNYKFILSISTESDDIDVNIVGLETSIQLNTATGSYLDDIGLIFKLYRNDGESDDSFRSRIKAFFQANLGGGCEPNMVTALAGSLGLLETQVDVITDEANVFTIEITIDVTFDLSLLNNVSEIVERSKAAGMYYDTRKGDSGIIIESENNIFMTQIGQTNNNQKVL